MSVSVLAGGRCTTVMGIGGDSRAPDDAGGVVWMVLTSKVTYTPRRLAIAPRQTNTVSSWIVDLPESLTTTFQNKLTVSSHSKIASTCNSSDYRNEGFGGVAHDERVTYSASGLELVERVGHIEVLVEVLSMSLGYRLNC